MDACENSVDLYWQQEPNKCASAKIHCENATKSTNSKKRLSCTELNETQLMHRFTIFLLLNILFVPVFAFSSTQAAETHPNILLIVGDDMGYADVGCYGSEIATPHIDALAGRGLRFNHYTTHPICSPARAALLTGRNAHSVATGWLSIFIAILAGLLLRDLLRRPEAIGPFVAWAGSAA